MIFLSINFCQETFIAGFYFHKANINTATGKCIELLKS